METFRLSEERSAIRIAINGEWSCQEFGAFLEDTNNVYRRLNSVFVLRQALDQEASSNRSLDKQDQDQDQEDDRDFSWHLQFFGFRHYFPGGTSGSDVPPYSKLIELSNAIVMPLQVDAISYASPGWIQLIGNLNPLKVIADFVSKWRAENTKREANWVKAQTDRMRIQADLAGKILEQAPKMPDRHNAGTSRLVELAEEVIKPTTKYLEHYGNDARIIDAEVVSVRQALPPPKRSRRKPSDQ
jgi:hypothetical protein